ncbi:gamma-glutamylcyclotransferase [Spiribacter halobius]|uniref:glutathione-specific gamma-glutamylcyclotransferase n=1 Tax=Sediminicurvatus halobius TaxID=2182432 RepID=A0A2U2MYN3_9GAMM|nr:gamma-glutamylcyclotransferase [Spiribacter halobius]PWG61912.1 gamma-glutamylcyclotransferase [Spiribacter halobius]UEX79210.1 gamma-glutamylcyclotransferase [Spiribacter halobius]
MSTNTIRQNQRMTRFDGHDEVWLFGYGSLIYKVDFPYIAAVPASITGWVRRFWQGSHDHRGTPRAPGRVATLVPQPGAVCQGMAYRVTPAVFGRLDYREKNGYLRFATELTLADGRAAEGLVYIATADNEAFAGEAPLPDIARQIAEAAGPSGSNREYLLRLAQALRNLGADDPHVFELERLVKGVRPPSPRPQP